MDSRERNIMEAGIEARGPIVQQPSSRLLGLPREIRDLIFTSLFASTQITFSDSKINWYTRKILRDNPRALATLRVCRQLNGEYRMLWLSKLQFLFDHPIDMLDKLYSLPPDTISAIRHIHVSEKTFVFKSKREEGNYNYYGLAKVLRMLPKLQLDTLTVDGSRDGITAYDSLERFIKEGSGWKELHFIANSSMLGFAEFGLEDYEDDPASEDNPTTKRNPQPSDWTTSLRQREGLDSSASVTIYESSEPFSTGITTSPQTPHTIEQRYTGFVEDYGRYEDRDMMETRKELRVVVKRGRGADILEQYDPPFERHDIRQEYGTIWEEVRQKYLEDDRSFPDADISEF